ncbi:MAG: hypothetical protein WC785_03515 [Tatlockia sp.]|jgi:hypothetical protein
MLTKDHVIETMQRLIQAPLPQESNFHARLYSAYRARIVSELAIAFAKEDENKRLEALTACLATNWNHIKGTFLSYTALPTDELTLLLCDIACYVAKEKNEPSINALTVLMPTVCGESSHSDYPNLTPVMNQDALFDIPVIDIKKLIRTHILSDNGAYLIPVLLLNSLEIPFKENAIGNPYYDYTKVESNSPFITLFEYQRLVSHSSHSKALEESLLEREILCTDKSSLFGHINQLLRALYLNSTEGLGSEPHAASGAYSAILSFRYYYNTLKKTLKTKCSKEEEAIPDIPKAVDEEIEKLFRFSFDVKTNEKAGNDLCIATRREELDTAVQEHWEILAKITLSEESRVALIKTAVAVLKEKRQHLKNALENDNHASEKAGLTQLVLDWLGVPFAISSLQEVVLLAAMQPAEIRQLCQDAEINKQIIKKIDSLDTLIGVLIESKPTSLEALFEKTGEQIAERLLQYDNEFPALIALLDPARIRMCCRVFPHNLHTADQLAHLLSELLPNQLNAVLDADILNSIARSPEQVGQFLNHFPPLEYPVIFNKLKRVLFKASETLDGMLILLGSLPLTSRNQVVELLKAQFFTLVTRAEDFITLLEDSNFADYDDPFVQIMRTLAEQLILTEKDFCTVFHALSSRAERDTFCFLLHERLECFNPLIQARTPDEMMAYFKQCDSFEAFERAFHFAPPECYHSILNEVLKDERLLPHLYSLRNLRKLAEYIASNQSDLFCEKLKGVFQALIDSPDTIHLIFATFPWNVAYGIVDQIDIRPLFSKAIDYCDFISEMMRIGTAHYFWRILEEDFVDAVQTNEDFKKAINTQHIPLKLRLYKEKKSLLEHYIKTCPKSFVAIATNLPEEEKIALFASIKAMLLPTIETMRDFIVNFYNVAPCSAIIVGSKSTLCRLIHSIGELRTMFLFMRRVRDVVYQTLKKKIPYLIATVEDFKTLHELLKNYFPGKNYFQEICEMQLTGLLPCKAIDMEATVQQLKLADKVQEGVLLTQLFHQLQFSVRQNTVSFFGEEKANCLVKPHQLEFK